MTKDELLKAIDEEIDRRVETYDRTHYREYSQWLAGAIAALRWIRDLIEERR